MGLQICYLRYFQEVTNLLSAVFPRGYKSVICGISKRANDTQATAADVKSNIHSVHHGIREKIKLKLYLILIISCSCYDNTYITSAAHLYHISCSIIMVIIHLVILKLSENWWYNHIVYSHLSDPTRIKICQLVQSILN